MELCAAHLGVELLDTMSEILQIEENYAWTDSTIVLSWLSHLPRMWQIFVGNRVSQIQQKLCRIMEACH